MGFVKRCNIFLGKEKNESGVGCGTEVLIRKYMGGVHYPFEME